MYGCGAKAKAYGNQLLLLHWNVGNESQCSSLIQRTPLPWPSPWTYCHSGHSHEQKISMLTLYAHMCKQADSDIHSYIHTRPITHADDEDGYELFNLLWVCGGEAALLDKAVLFTCMLVYLLLRVCITSLISIWYYIDYIDIWYNISQYHKGPVPIKCKCNR